VHLKKCGNVKDTKEISPRNRLDSFSSSSSYEGGMSVKDIRNKTSGPNVAKERILAKDFLERRVIVQQVIETYRHRLRNGYPPYQAHLGTSLAMLKK
jgi:hypothetical protein